MEHFNENQYDDDLTVGTEEYDDSYYTDSDDLFAFSANEESPISRLKSLILSIDWEITDEVLMQFNEELIDLRDIWAGQKIHLVYVQALEKISKYIYQRKADSHPSAIKLLLTLYHNLEKIVSTEDMTEEEKNEILLEDVKRFEGLKHHIAKGARQSPPVREAKIVRQEEVVGPEGELLNLKAIVLGIDWEITDKDLEELRAEVIRLEKKFAQSRPRLILLQGIGTLGAYIKLKKSNSHADAFKVLHLFYESLEKIVDTPMSIAEEKEVLFPAVEKFNSFKTMLGPTISPEGISRSEIEAEEDVEDVDAGSPGVMPALSDVDEEVESGFQADKEAKALGLGDVAGVDGHVETFFGAQDELGLDSPEDDLDETDIFVAEELEAALSVDDEVTELHIDKVTALEGVNVEEDDDDEELSPGLQGGHLSDLPSLDEPLEPVAELSVEEGGTAVGHEEESQAPIDAVNESPTAIQGVDVDSEADDDSEEPPLPLEDGELAPALAFAGEPEDEDVSDDTGTGETEAADEILGRISGFFGESEEVDDGVVAQSEEPESNLDFPEEVDGSDIDSEVAELDELPGPDHAQDDSEVELLRERALQGVDVDTEADDDTGEPALPRVEGELAPALSMDEENSSFGVTDSELDDALPEEEISESLDNLFGEPSEIETASNEDEQVIDEGLIDDELIDAEPAAVELEMTLDDFDSASELIELDNSVEALDDDAGVGVQELASVAVAAAAVIPAIQLAKPDLEPASVTEEKDQEVHIPSEKTTSIEAVDVFLETPPEEVPDFGAPSDEMEEVDEVVFELVDELEDVSPVDDVSKLLSDDDLPLPEGTDAESILEDSSTANLNVCISALEVEIEDKVIRGLFSEIDQLRERWVDQPHEKTFLQLLSTVTLHVDKYRYDSSIDALPLIKSISKALTEVTNDLDIITSQEILLVETNKVLTWQQLMLDSQATQAADGGSQFVKPVHTKETLHGAQEEFEEALLSYDEGIPQETLSVDDASVTEPIEDMDKDNLLKKEIKNLRATLQNEISVLRKEIGEGRDK